MSRGATALICCGLIGIAGCRSEFAVRPVPRIVADDVGQQVAVLQQVFGEPRRIDVLPMHLVYVWFFAQVPAGAPVGFHGCQLEVTVDSRTSRVLGYSMSNVGWSECGEIERRIRVASR